jgi:hypothetical protein
MTAIARTAENRLCQLSGDPATFGLARKFRACMEEILFSINLGMQIYKLK